MSKKENGFTLAELLVCLGIIGVLLAILFSVFGQTRRAGNKAACQSNLRQIGGVLRQYVTDNDEAWPSRASWDDLTFSKQTLQGCPDAIVPTFPYRKEGVPGYAYNTALTVFVQSAKGKDPVGVRDKDITFPSFTVVVCEEALGRSAAYAPNPDAQVIHGNPPRSAEQGWMRHNGGCNYLFADGRVQWYAPDAVGANIIGTGDGMKPKFAL